MCSSSLLHYLCVDSMRLALLPFAENNKKRIFYLILSYLLLDLYVIGETKHIDNVQKVNLKLNSLHPLLEIKPLIDNFQFKGHLTPRKKIKENYTWWLQSEKSCTFYILSTIVSPNLKFQMKVHP